MTGARRAGRGGWLLVLVLATAAAWAAPVEVRVRSGGGRLGTTVLLELPATARVVDRTPGATAGGAGVVSAGRTFADEITLDLPDTAGTRDLAIDVSDDLVSDVRIGAAPTGSVVHVFVRRPVRYVVRRADPATLEVTLTPQAEAAAPKPKRHVRQAAAPKPQRDGGQVAVDAETLTYDREHDTLHARGGVTLTRGDVTLQADQVDYDRAKEIAHAKGRVSLIDPEITLRGAEAEVDLQNELGWVDQADVAFPENRYHLEAARVEKTGDASYEAEDGAFTTCRCGGLERPTWSIWGREADVTLGGYGVARGASFRVKDTPLLYLPCLPFPAATERQSGFLLPRVGYSNRRGFQYEQPFYWAIDKSQDATIATDVETAARLGVAGEYRYVLSRDAKGVLAAGYWNEHIGGPDNHTDAPGVASNSDVPENRFLFLGHHESPFVGDSTLYGDLFAVSDDVLLREISMPTGIESGNQARSTRFTRSRLGAIKTWDGGLVQAETTYYQDLIDPQDLTQQEIPTIRAEHAVPLLGGLAVARMRGDTTLFQRDQGFDGLRAQLAPELWMPLPLGRYLQGSVRAVGREQLYYLTDRRQTGIVVPNDETIQPRFREARPDELPLLDRSNAQASAEVTARIGTELSRVYDFHHFGLERLRHTIEPEVRFIYVPSIGREFSSVVLPQCTGAPNERRGVDCNGTLFAEGYLFDQADAINRRSFLAYGVTTRLFGRGHVHGATAATDADVEGEASTIDEGEVADESAAPRELARLSLLHGYDVSRVVVDGSHASDVDLALRVTPVPGLGLGYAATMSFEQQKLIGQAVGVALRDPWTPPPPKNSLQQATTLLASYRFVTENASRGLAPNSVESRLFRNDGVEELAAGIYLRLGDYLGFSYLSRYDFTTSLGSGNNVVGPHFLEQTWLVRLLSRCDCWIFDIGVTDRYDTNETLVRAQFTLVGLGGNAGRSFYRSLGFGAIPGLPGRPFSGGGGSSAW